MDSEFKDVKSSQSFDELDQLIESFELEELEERIELGCFGGCRSEALCMWST